MKKMICYFVMISLLTAFVPINSDAMEIKKTDLTENEINSFKVFDTGEIDNISGGYSRLDDVSATFVGFLMLGVIIAGIGVMASH